MTGSFAILLLFTPTAFNSTVKKPQDSWYPTKSGTPGVYTVSILDHVILFKLRLHFCHKADSGFKVITQRES